MTFDLCEWNKTLAPSLAESANDVRVARFLRDSFPYPYTERDAERFIEAALKDSAGLSRAIIVQGRAVGAIALTKMSDVYQKSAELGYWLAPAYWGMGIMTESVRRVCAQGFARWDVVRIFAEPFAGNAASRCVLEKCGFAFEGVKKMSVYKNGAYSDSCMYALIRE